MSAETILHNVLLEVGLDVPNPQVSSTDYEVKQIRAFINAAGRDVASRAEWSRLYVDWSIAGGVASAALPADFQKMSEGGAVRVAKAGFNPIRGVVSPEQWQMLLARPSAQLHYHMASGALEFSPALPAEGANVRYVSKHWVQGADVVSQNGDVILVPERLVEQGAIWRWKRQKSLPFDDILAEFEADLIAELKADRGHL